MVQPGPSRHLSWAKLRLSPAGELNRKASIMHRALQTVAAALALAVGAGCQSLSAGIATQSEVEAAHGRLAEAYSTCNAPAFLDEYGERFTFTTSSTPGAITSRSGLQAYLAYGCGLNPNPTATVKQQSIRFVGAHAIVTGQYLFRVPAAGKVVDVVQNYTAVFGRERESWKVVAHHVSVVP